MVVCESSAGGGHCGGSTWASLTSSCAVRQGLLLPVENVEITKKAGWTANRAQQQLFWDTIQSLKEKAASAFLPTHIAQPCDPFRETYNDGGLFGSGCNYAVGYHGIQGRQPKSEDYVLHLALGPNLFAPFDDCDRACLACVLDGHDGTGAVQYVAERFPAYLLEDLPRLRCRPAAAMRSALHRIDEELTALGHNSGTTVNALLLVDNRITVINTGDCRCILYDWVEERAIQVTQDHNLHSTKERERVLGEGAALSGCGGYVVLPCPTDGAKLLGVTKALGHAGVKALQRSNTMNSISGILESSIMASGQQQQGLSRHLAARPPSSSSLGHALPLAQAAGVSSSSFSSRTAWVERDCGRGSATASTEAASGSGMSEYDPDLSAAASDSAAASGGHVDVDTCPCSAPCERCEQVLSVVPVSRRELSGSLKSVSSTTLSQNFDVAAPSTFATTVAAALAAAVTSRSFSESDVSGACGTPAACSSSRSLPTGISGFLLTCEPDEFEFTIEDDRHLVLMGCDGVFDGMNNTEACKTALRQLSTSNSCMDAAREVTHRACRLGSCDNITALVLRFGRKPIVRRQSFSVLSLRRINSNTSGDLAGSGGSLTSRS